MAIPPKTKFIVVKIETSWFDFHLEPDGKYVTLMGKDKDREETSPFTGEVYYDSHVLVSVAFEHHRSDYHHAEILGEAWDDEGIKYLIIQRQIK